MESLGPGSVVLTSSFNAQFFEDDGKELARFGYKAPKGKAFVLVLLGATEKGAVFDAIGALKALGWTPPAEVEGA
jgi:hypothetical protein